MTDSTQTFNALSGCRGSDLLQSESNGMEVREGSAHEREASRMAVLIRTVEGEIIPRLMLALRTGPVPARHAGDDLSIGLDRVPDFTQLVLSGSQEEVAAFVERLRAEGASLEAVFLNLLAPTARRLGQMWESDHCDFTAVTIGLWRLQRALHDLSPAFQIDAEMAHPARSVVLTAMPGEQHTFGLSMVAEFFRRAGWDVIDGPVATASELLSSLRLHAVGVIGISVSGERHLESLTLLIRDIRRASRHRELRVIVGGAVFIDHPEFVRQVGADGTATDARQAVALAESLVTQKASA